MKRERRARGSICRRDDISYPADNLFGDCYSFHKQPFNVGTGGDRFPLSGVARRPLNRPIYPGNYLVP
ncbi:MAG: hypothetical protein WBJ70_00540 [Bacilli bacterium]